jgi:hypothetical protein
MRQVKKIHSEKRPRLNQRLALATGIKAHAKRSKPMPTTILSGRNKWLRAVCWMCWGYWLRYSLFFSISAQTCIKREKSDGDVYDVRFGSKADIALPPIDVRFTPESGHWPTRSGCLLRANSGFGGAAQGKTGSVKYAMRSTLRWSGRSTEYSVDLS